MTTTALTASHWPPDATAPLLDTTIGALLRDAAAEAPDRAALVTGAADPALRRTWTYAALLDEAERTARALLGRFQPGERVAVWAHNVPEWVLLELGAALAGMTLVTVNPVLRAAEVAYVLRQSRASGLFLVPELRGVRLGEVAERIRPELPELREVVALDGWDAFLAGGSPAERLPEVRPDDPALILYTSGTTGFPKGAVLHHRAVVNNARYCADIQRTEPGDVVVNPMPLFHVGGCVLGVLGRLHCQGTHVLMPAFEPGLQLALVESERSAVLVGVPTMLIGMSEHPDFAGRDLSSVRHAFSGGATVPPDLVRRIEAALGVPFTIVYGQTEVSGGVTQTSPDDPPEDRAGSVGRPYPRMEARIADPLTGATVAPGAIGELRVRGPLVMREYFDQPAATAAAIDAEGWLHTGDLCSMDERGYCRVEGRLKEMIIRGGENIYPREIEQLLFTHPAVGDVAVVGVPDERWGEQVAAFVRPAPGAAPTEQELFDFCREHLAAFKTPRHWVFVDELPLTPSGKVQKFVLRERFERA
ncbi:MAG TPA: AMP-binding protein [Candidatus Dormibacteraeota bacterium]|jgi:acyl-CoA synthetase (AMP-forming)/AMP-acid ligase II